MAQNGRRNTKRRWVVRIGWLLFFWGAGVIALALVAYILRMLMNWAGFSA